MRRYFQSVMGVAGRVSRDILKHALIFGVASLFFASALGAGAGLGSWFLHGTTYEEARPLILRVFFWVLILGATLGALFGLLFGLSEWRRTRRAQALLKLKGYYNGARDGWFNATTQEAIREFQAAEGLVASGVLDETTATRLGVLE